MAQRKKNASRTDQLEGGISVSDEFQVEAKRGPNKLTLALGILMLVGGALYVERNVLVPASEGAASVEDAGAFDAEAGEPGNAFALPRDSPAEAAVVDRVPPKAFTHPAQEPPPPPPPPLAAAAVRGVKAAGSGDRVAIVASGGGGGGGSSSGGGGLESMDLQDLKDLVAVRTKVVSDLKRKEHLVMEHDPRALAAIKELQEACRALVPRLYGPEPYRLEMRLKFPAVMPDYDAKGPDGTIVIEMAPLKDMPYTVMLFLNMVVHEWKGGSFHRNAAHVKQVTVQGQHPGYPLAFQEYSPDFPHNKYTLGCAGRPSSSAFYVSTMNNVVNHGPGSQGHKTEADACFAKVVGGESKSGAYVETVKRLDGQPGAKGANGFVSPASNYVNIASFTLLPHGEGALPS